MISAMVSNTYHPTSLSSNSTELTDYSIQNLSLCLLVLGCIVLGYLRFYTEYIHIRIRNEIQLENQANRNGTGNIENI
jgi:hypothetical protein